SLNHSVERPDNNGGYERGNMVWATWKEQSRNRRNSRLLTFRGRTQCLAAWAEEIGLLRDVIRSRVRSGWTTEEALSTPSLWKVKDRKRRTVLTRKEKNKRQRAYNKLRRALYKGTIVKPSKCEFPGCQKTQWIDAHHHLGYEGDHVLDVKWLCRKHHRRMEYGQAA